MKQESKNLTFLGVQFFAYIQANKLLTVKTGDISNAFGITAKAEARLFSSLNKKNLIAQVIRGLYLVPERMPPGGIWTPSPQLALYEFMKAKKATGYQITGLYAFSYWKYSTQIPQVYTVYNDKVSGYKVVAGNRFQFIIVNRKRLIGSAKINIKERGLNLPWPVASRAKIIFDAIYDYDRFGTLPMAYEWLKNLKNDSKTLRELIEILLKIGNVAAKKRVGFLLEKEGFLGKYWQRLLNVLDQKKGFIQLVPNSNWKGRTDKKWGIIINEI